MYHQSAAACMKALHHSEPCSALQRSSRCPRDTAAGLDSRHTRHPQQLHSCKTTTMPTWQSCQLLITTNCTQMDILCVFFRWSTTAHHMTYNPKMYAGCSVCFLLMQCPNEAFSNKCTTFAFCSPD